MKRILPFLTAVLLLFSVTAQAQSNKYVFCEVIPIGKFFKGGCTLRVNYGQIRSARIPKKAQIGGTSVSSFETWILKYCVEGFTAEQIEEVYDIFNLREP